MTFHNTLNIFIAIGLYLNITRQTYIVVEKKVYVNCNISDYNWNAI